VLFATLALLASTAASGVAGPWIANDAAQVRLVSRWSAAAAGSDAGLGLQFELAPGWHVYWKNAGDAGYPPAIDFGPEVIRKARLQFPAPERFDLPGGLVANGYAGRVIYPIAARLADGSRGTARIAADLDYLVCASECVPYRVAPTLELPLAEQPTVDAEIEPMLAAALARVPLPIGELPGSRAVGELHPGGGPAFELDLALEAEGLEPGTSPRLFFETQPLLAIEGARFEPGASISASRFVATLRPLDETRPLPETLTLAWTATGFLRGGRPLALSGTIALDRPSPPATGAPVRSGAAAVLVLGVAAWLILRRRRRGNPSERTTTPGATP